MSLDTFANIADIVSIPIGIIGYYFRFYINYNLTRVESRKGAS